MNYNNQKATSIQVKPGSLIARIFLISMGLLMSHEVLAGNEEPIFNPFTYSPQATTTYIVGDVGPGGGIVFWLDGTGRHGLEAQTHDYHNSDLFSWQEAITDAASYNSPACPTNPQLTPGCWHLPTKTELELLYEQNDVVGGFASGGYWSSTEGDSNDAWLQYFRTGNQDNSSKLKELALRSVRAF